MPEPITITLNTIQRYRPCRGGWQTALDALGKTKADDEPIPVSRFLDTNGLDDTLWVLRGLPEYEALWRLYGVWCAKQVEHLMTDARSHEALRVAERYALGLATKDELSAAQAAARDAACAAARASARDAAWAAAWAARYLARDAPRDAARDAQSATLRRLLDTRTIEIEWDGTTYLYELEAPDANR